MSDVYRLAYQGTANSIADEYGIPRPVFASLIEQESGWNIAARGAAGEIGLTQLMPGTARDLGVNPHDPLANLRGGASYLAQQYKAFGSWENALIAYNAGPGTFAAVSSGKPTARDKAAYAQGSTYASEVLQRAGNSGFVEKTSAAQDFPGLDIFENLKIFGYSPADIFRGVVGIPSQVVEATVGNVPVVGDIVRGATDALTGQNDFFKNLMSGEWWRASLLYILGFLALAALMFASTSALLK